MTKNDIKLSEIKLHGQAQGEMKDGAFCMTVTRANPLGHCKPGIPCVHYAEIPKHYHLPLRIDITAMVDVPSLYVMFGNGHVTFGNYFNNRRIDDICEPQNKTNYFDNRIPMGKLATVSLIYGRKEMQILVDGEERYYSKREKYMKSSLIDEMNQKGFTLRLSCDKRTKLQISSICITEYNDMAGIEHGTDPAPYKYDPPAVKPSLEECLTELPDTLAVTVTDIDRWLRLLHPIKFKRQITTSGDQTKISYVASRQGFSYAIHISGDTLYHTLQWYIITQGKPETWERKANQMEDTLFLLSQEDAAFAARMFANLQDCVGGYGPGCIAKTPYTFEGKKAFVCHGKMYFNMNVSEFDDVKRFVSAVNSL